MRNCFVKVTVYENSISRQLPMTDYKCKIYSIIWLLITAVLSVEFDTYTIVERPMRTFTVIIAIINTASTVLEFTIN